MTNAPSQYVAVRPNVPTNGRLFPSWRDPTSDNYMLRDCGLAASMVSFQMRRRKTKGSAGLIDQQPAHFEWSPSQNILQLLSPPHSEWVGHIK